MAFHDCKTSTMTNWWKALVGRLDSLVDKPLMSSSLLVVDSPSQAAPLAEPQHQRIYGNLSELNFHYLALDSY